MNAPQTTALLSALDGFRMAHGVDPDYLLMTADIAKQVLMEIASNFALKDLVKVNGVTAPMTFRGVEVGQLQGVNRVELSIDAQSFRARGGRL